MKEWLGSAFTESISISCSVKWKESGGGQALIGLLDCERATSGTKLKIIVRNIVSMEAFLEWESLWKPLLIMRVVSKSLRYCIFKRLDCTTWSNCLKEVYWRHLQSSKIFSLENRNQKYVILKTLYKVTEWTDPEILWQWDISVLSKRTN